MNRLRAVLFVLAAWFAAGGAFAQAPAAGDGGQVLVLLRLPPPHFRPEASYAGAYDAGAGPASRLRIARRIAQARGLKLVTDWPMPLVGLDCYVMAVPAGRSAAEEAEALSREPGVAWSEPMETYRGQAEAAAPNDPLFRLQPAAQAWRLAELRQVATGRGVRVAVVDSRIDAGHPDLAGQVQVQRDFVAGRPGPAERHGTGVAGVIAAIADNRQGIAGVAPGARLLALRACWQEAADTVCDTLSLAKAISYAVENGAQVINLSLAGPPGPLLGRLVDAGLARGVVVVGAIDARRAGGGFPASHPGVIAVASDAAAPNPGAYVAPGRDVPTTEPGGGWSMVSGSSYAAAHVSGLVALMRETQPGSRAPALSRTGGVIDACASVLRAACAGAPRSSAAAAGR